MCNSKNRKRILRRKCQERQSDDGNLIHIVHCFELHSSNCSEKSDFYRYPRSLICETTGRGRERESHFNHLWCSNVCTMMASLIPLSVEAKTTILYYSIVEILHQRPAHAAVYIAYQLVFILQKLHVNGLCASCMSIACIVQFAC